MGPKKQPVMKWKTKRQHQRHTDVNEKEDQELAQKLQSSTGIYCVVFCVYERESADSGYRLLCGCWQGTLGGLRLVYDLPDKTKLARLA